MKYLKLFENVKPLHSFKLYDIGEYFLNKIDDTKPNDFRWTKSKNDAFEFLKKTLIGKKVDIINDNISQYEYTVKDITANKNFGYSLVFTVYFKNDRKSFNLKTDIGETTKINIYDDIPVKSKRILADIEKIKTQERFDL